MNFSLKTDKKIKYVKKIDKKFIYYFFFKKVATLDIDERLLRKKRNLREE